MATQDNLKEAFAGESQANRKYLAFAKKADAEGKPQVARLFRAAAAAETVHAHAHLRVLGDVKTTADNLQVAVDGEGFESQTMYPKFVAEATKEANQAALMSFQNAMAVEKVHYKLYGQALVAVKEGKDLPAATIYVCEICGNTVVGDAPDTCDVCGAPKHKFTKVD
ncbi:MAG: rubrerythrin family protein [Planctomycetota bacterium]|jgi:rubrerythrin